MPLLVVALGILALFTLVAGAKVNPFLAFLLVALGVGLAGGMDLATALASVRAGIGDTLGGLVVILGLGAMLGKLVADAGAARQITDALLARFGRAHVQWAVVATGFVVGIPMFYTVGFVVMVPLVFSVAVATGLPLLYVGLPMLASLSVTHGYLPPHPAPTGIAVMFGADIGRTLLYGLVVAVPAILLGGPWLARRVQHLPARALPEFVAPAPVPEERRPSTAASLLTALLPVLLIALAATAELVLDADSPLRRALAFVGDPAIALLIAVIVAVGWLGLARGWSMAETMASVSGGLQGITAVLFIIAGAGALKQVLIDSGVSDYIGELLAGSTASPLLLAWGIATVIRVCVGSATVAGLTAAGIAAPLLERGGVSAELMVLAIGSGSLMLSHVNDSGFWLFKEYFGLSVGDTLRSWTVMETVVGVTGLAGVLVLDAFV